jgi:hypothetical protein
MDNLYCPVRTTLPDGYPRCCLKEDCSWWNVDKNCCAILSISNSLIVLRTTRQSLTTKMHKEE